MLIAPQLTEEEKRVINRRFEYDGEEGQVEMLCGRRKSKKTYEYEVKWVGRRENKNSWITREKCALAFIWFCARQSVHLACPAAAFVGHQANRQSARAL